MCCVCGVVFCCVDLVTRARAWPPEVAGVLVGVLQWPVRYFFSDGLGSATSYCTITAVPLKAIFGAGKLSERYTNCADQ